MLPYTVREHQGVSLIGQDAAEGGFTLGMPKARMVNGQAPSTPKARKMSRQDPSMSKADKIIG